MSCPLWDSGSQKEGRVFSGTRHVLQCLSAWRWSGPGGCRTSSVRQRGQTNKLQPEELEFLPHPAPHSPVWPDGWWSLRWSPGGPLGPWWFSGGPLIDGPPLMVFWWSPGGLLCFSWWNPFPQNITTAIFPVALWCVLPFVGLRKPKGRPRFFGHQTRSPVRQRLRTSSRQRGQTNKLEPEELEFLPHPTPHSPVWPGGWWSLRWSPGGLLGGS